jgi:hypothetical protein
MGTPNQNGADLIGIPASATRSFPRPLRITLAALQGIATGVLCLAVAFAVAYVLVPAPKPEARPCIEDDLGPCLPDLGPIVAALTIIAVVVPVVSPLVAWILRLPRPWYFLVPGLWISALVVLGSSAWTSNTIVELVSALTPYAALAMWTVTRAAKKRTSP